MMSQLLDTARTAQRICAADPTEATRSAAAEAQRAYDHARRDAERLVRAERRAERHAQWVARLNARLAEPDEGGRGMPLGWVTRSRAHYLMMAPAVTGGFVAVETEASPSLVALLGRGGRWHIACGSIALGEAHEHIPADREAVRVALRADLALWASWPVTLWSAIQEQADTVVGVLDLIERR